MDQTPHAFTFGDAEPVLAGRGLLDYIECAQGDRWYHPPVSFDGLAKSFRASVHHASALLVKRNVLSGTFIPHKLLTRSDFNRFALDFLVFGNGFLERVDSRLPGRAFGLRPALARYMRRGVDLDQYFMVKGYQDEHTFEPGKVFHLVEHDINQEIYGLPEYMPSLNSSWLNESATLFRRRYYANGSHAGFILYMTDPSHTEDDVTALRKALRDSKGPGNFRNLFMYAPGGKKDGLQLIPVSEVAAKDEFAGIKNITRDDQLAMHRVPPQLLGVMPNNTGGFGDAGKAAEVFWWNEIKPLQERMRELNDWIGDEVIRFGDYPLASAA